MNSDGNINFKVFSDSELKEALSGIDANKFPLNYRNLIAEIASREHLASTSILKPPKQLKQNKEAPSAISYDGLIFGTVASIAMLTFAAFGLYRNDIVLPTRVGAQHIHNTGAKVFFVFIILIVISNIMRLLAWRKHGGTDNDSYQTANSISLFICIAFIIFVTFFWS